MVIYDLSCEHGHRFEGWFKSADDLVEQQQGHLLNCPVCGSSEVVKLPTASRINRRHPKEDLSPDKLSDIEGSLREKIYKYVDDNYDDVGNQFPEEARKIHYGETEQRNIRGTASQDEVNELHEEGVNITALPLPLVEKNKLN